MSNLYRLVQDAKRQDPKALGDMIRMFEPKIKQTSRFIPQSEREDLEQELRIQIVKAVERFDTKDTPGFWTFFRH